MRELLVQHQERNAAIVVAVQVGDNYGVNRGDTQIQPLECDQ